MIRITKVNTPEGEDINSLVQGHSPEVLKELLENREEFFSSNESSNERSTEERNTTPEPDIGTPHQPPTSNEQLPRFQHGQAENHAVGVTSSHEQPATSNEQPATNLDPTNPERITYQTPTLTIEIWGGIEYMNLHRLKLSLYLKNPANNTTFRDEVNLYSHKQRKAFLEAASEELDMAHSELKHELEAFIRAVEAHRLEAKERQEDSLINKAPELSEKEQQQALQLLRDPELVNHLRRALPQAGLIGEESNGLLLFMIFLTRCFDNPLHALVHGSSGSGKTNLLKSVLNLVPEEAKFTTTALSENVLFRPPTQDYWKNKVLMIEDLDGVYQALLALRELMSNQHISKFVSEPDPKTGQFRQVLLEADGPVVIAGATTRDKVYEDNSNRSFLLHVDESKAHEQAILEHQNKEAAGLIDKTNKEAACHTIHNLQRMLNKDVRVINPFQPHLQLPDYVFKKLRTNTHYITLIKAITFLHQYQRPQYQGPDGTPCIETTLEDVALANELSKHSLLRKSDELSGQVRQFFEALKATLQKENQTTFLAKTIRSKLRMHPMKFSRYVNELRQRGYVKKVAGKEKGSFEYEVEVWDDYQVIKKGLEVMDRTLEKLYKHHPTGRYEAETRK